MIHKPSPGTRGLLSNQGGISPQGEKFTAIKKKNQKHQVIEISKLSTYILYRAGNAKITSQMVRWCI